MAFMKRHRDYYKYEYETVESLPTYASADEGLAGKNGISFSPANMYFCVAQNVTGSVKNQYGYGVVWSFGDSKFKMDSYSYNGYVIGGAMPSASINRIEWSNDKTNWTTVTLPDTEYRKYYRFVFDGSETNLYGSMGMRYFNFTGEKRTEIEVQKEEYNHYKDSFKAYNIMQREKAYWKNWQQPILTANGTMGGDSFACSSDTVLGSRNTYYAFNGILGTDTDTFCLSTNSGNLYFYNPIPIRIKTLTVTNRNETNPRVIRSGTFYGSNDGTDWTSLATFTNDNLNKNGTWSIAVNASETYKYFRLYMSAPQDSYVGLNELNISAEYYDEHYTYKAYNIVDPYWESGSQTFNYTGTLQTYTVPEGVTSVQVDCVGAKGYTASLEGGLGGRVKCNLSVTPGQTFYVWVANAHSNITTPEYNASDIRTSSADITSEEGLLSRLIVAGGGGDGSLTNFGGGEGGHGGGLIGGSGRNGYGTEATGGTQTAGGTGGTHGAVYGGGSGQGYPGTFGLGGVTKRHDASYGGCGGAGWYGGGGGSMCSVNKIYSCNGVAGAGGSSYTDPELCTEVKHTQGYQSGNGYVKITYKRRRL